MGGDSGLEGRPKHLMTDQINIDRSESTHEEENNKNIFGRSGKVLRSPTLRNTQIIGETSVAPSTQTGAQTSTGNSEGNSTTSSAAEKALEMAIALDDFVKSKNNIHGEVKTKATLLRKQLQLVKNELQRWKVKAEKAEKELEEANLKSGPPKPTLQTPSVSTPVTNKRLREKSGANSSPVEPSVKKAARTENPARTREWREVVGKSKKATAENTTKKRSKAAEKPKLNELKNSKAEALLVAVNEGVSHAEIIRKVKSDPKLKLLGEKVARIRRTKKGDMLFELQKDPKIKSAAFKEALEEVLGTETKVRALSHVVTVQIRDLDETTTVEEVSKEMKEQFQLGEEIQSSNIRIRSSYGGTQTAEFRLQAEDAKKLMERGKIKVGWTVNAFKLMERERAEARRCYKCLGFGHLAKECTGEDRSQCCRKCGEVGHKARTCRNEPKCLLCTGKDNKHETGGRKCPAYKEASGKK